MKFNECLKKAEQEYEMFCNRDDRGDPEGALEHLRNVTKALEKAMEDITLCRKRVSVDLFFKRQNKKGKHEVGRGPEYFD